MLAGQLESGKFYNFINGVVYFTQNNFCSKNK